MNAVSYKNLNAKEALKNLLDKPLADIFNVMSTTKKVLIIGSFILCTIGALFFPLTSPIMTTLSPFGQNALIVGLVAIGSVALFFLGAQYGKLLSAFTIFNLKITEI